MIKTKIIATIGPSSNSLAILRKLITAGMNVARLNFSHGNHKEHAGVIKKIRSLSKELNKPIAILLDLQGPKIRTGILKDGAPILLRKNRSIRITTKNVEGTNEIIGTTYRNLPKDVKKNDTILLDDGLIELTVTSKNNDTVTCKVVNGGLLKEHKGINLPGVNVSAPPLTRKDKDDLLFGIKSGVDYIALSFVRSSKDLTSIKSFIRKRNTDLPVIAKIEKPEAVDKIDEIIMAADGIMVARGDLGVEMNPEHVPIIQKKIIQRVKKANKPVITATQMLESMINNPIPTRAEASDVANAVFDGSGAIMLSGETAVGKYPVKTVRTMIKIVKEAERSPFMKYNVHYEKDPNDLVTHAIAQSSVNILHEVDAKAIISFSLSGKTSRAISKHRPFMPIYSFTPFRKNYNRLALIWGLTPLLVKPIKDTKSLIAESIEVLVDKKYIKKNDLVIIVTGLAFRSGSTNVLKIHRIGYDD